MGLYGLARLIGSQSASVSFARCSIRCNVVAVDTEFSPIGIKVSNEDIATLNISRDPFHGDWNYTIHPHLNHVLFYKRIQSLKYLWKLSWKILKK
ncbi:MAG: hypothetical protein E6I80_01405 [Chloroflexi bacterium]|nr:MAG: hypothetical protein E6I80_01405 [Chloroflexota bacterium]